MQMGHDRPFAVITGASRGIGAAYATALAAQGYDLLLTARDQTRVDVLAGTLAQRHGVQIAVERLDLADPDAAHRLFVAARGSTHHVDLLVNNAGFGLFGPFLDQPMPRIQNMLRVHVNSVVESIRLFLPAMVERRAGAIVTVASTAGFFPLPYMAVYAATKAFLIHFTQGLAEEVRPFGVHLQVCCPGSTETDFHTTAGFRPRNPLGRHTAAEVVAASLRGLKRGPVVVTVGRSGALLRLLSRCVPDALLIKAAGHWLREAGGKSSCRREGGS